MSTSNGKTNIGYPKAFELHAAIKQEIDRFAKVLQSFPEEYDITNQVSGAELLERGIGEIKQNGLIKPVEIHETYDLPAKALRNINHVAKLREFWRAKGFLGIHEYLNMIEDYIQAMQGMYPSLWKNGTYIGVKDGTQIIPDPEFLKKVDAANKLATKIQMQ
jgi:hypothetical protein